VQQMRVNMAWIQLQLVDSGQTYHVQAETITASLECFLQTMDPAPRRDLHLSLGKFVVMTFAALPEFGMHKVQADRERVFLFPELVIRMKSTLQVETRELAYEFDSSFPLQPGEDLDNRIDIVLDLVKWFYLWGKLEELRKNVEGSLAESGLLSPHSEWWEQPLRSNSLGNSSRHNSSAVESASISQVAALPYGPRTTTPEPVEASGPSPGTSPPEKPPSLTYRSISTRIEQPRFRRFDVSGETFKSATGVSVKRSLPIWVHEYATVPIESVMKILLKIYAHRLRKGDLEDGEGEGEDTGSELAEYWGARSDVAI